MAELVSPGVSVTVTDESFYAAAGTGTVPMILIATAQDKTAPDGSGVAAYTTKAQAGQAKLITSQRELLTNYGNPEFKTLGGTPLHGHELNEYGLQAAYSFLGIANRAYVLRADIDLNELEARNSEPTSDPVAGSYWLDIENTRVGIKTWDATNEIWVSQDVIKLTQNEVTGTISQNNVAPKNIVGRNGDFAVVFVDETGITTSEIKVFQKVSNVWEYVEIDGGGTDWEVATGSDFQIAPHTALPLVRSTGGALEEGDVLLQNTIPNNGTSFAIKLYDSVTGQYSTENTVGYKTSREAYLDYGISTVTEGDIWLDFNATAATITVKRHNGQQSLILNQTDITLLEVEQIPEAPHNNANVSLKIIVNDMDTVNGANGIINVSFANYDSDGDNVLSYADILQAFTDAIDAADPVLTMANEIDIREANGLLTVTSVNGYNVRYEAGDVTGFGPGNIFIGNEPETTDPVTFSNWENLDYVASTSELTGTIADGTLWYDALVSDDRIDILYNNAGTWATYPNDVNVAASEPTLQSDNASALQTGDLWVSSADLENYPVIYKWSGSTWVEIDKTDQVTKDGIVFADVRPASTAGLDDDAPNAELYPYDILVWNKRASGGNVKQWDAVNEIWVDYSGNKNDGTPYMLRKAQRRAVVRQLQAAISSNTEIRNEANRFNLIACPGYPELLDEMVTLNTDRKETAFIVADAPLRLAADATSVQNWATNANGAVENGEDGLTTNYTYSAVYYPHGLTSALDGTNIVVPSSHIALRTLAFNDQVAFPWFAPAGFQRGVVTNATSVGYIDSTSGEYVPVSLSEGQRDALYINKVNPIGNFPNRGLAVFGQKTLSASTSALDRVNVARLVVYIRERLDDIVKPFLFEPNDEITRQNAKVVVDRFLGNLVAQRGLFDFVTVCDTTNNTPERIDRNELWIDVAIQPVKAVEFIYIPIRVQNTLGQTN